MTPEIIQILNKKLPDWAVKPNPMKSNMSVIHPMAIIERLNEAFTIGGWIFKTQAIDCTKEIQKTKNGDRTVYMSSVHAELSVPKYNIHIEQFGGSTNDDKGDALKGGATDALTKIASYLNIGANIYKGAGNADIKAPKTPYESAQEAIKATKTQAQLETIATRIKESKSFTKQQKDELLAETSFQASELGL